MMNTHPILRRTIILLTLGSMAIGQIPFALAASVNLNDVPLAVVNVAKPNFIFGYDDSGSMDFEVLLTANDGALWWNTTNRDNGFYGWDNTDTYVGIRTDTTPPYTAGRPPHNTTGPLNFNLSGDANSTWKKYAYLFPNGASGAGDRVQGDDNPGDAHFAAPPTAEFAWLRSSAYNPLYYDPNKTYVPWTPSNDGSSTTATTTWSTTTAGTTTYTSAVATAAPSQPGLRTSVTLNLTVTQSTPITSATSSTDKTFRVQSGMLVPSGSTCLKTDGSGGVITAPAIAVRVGASPLDTATEYNCNIPYSPATYYVVDTLGIDAVAPDGSNLRKVTIAAGTAQMQNFANWFSYYRKRKLMMAGSFGTALASVKGVRAGLVKFNNRSAVTMYDVDSTTDSLNERRLFGQIFSTDSGGGTPTKDTLGYIGQEFMRTNTGAPIQYACQLNAAFIITDGFANASGPSTAGNADGGSNAIYAKTYSVPDSTNTSTQKTVALFPAGTSIVTPLTSPFSPYKDAASDTIADLAMYYFLTNLRTDLDPTTSSGKVIVDTRVALPQEDHNPHLHMNTYAMGLGVKGTIYGTGVAAATDPYNNAPDWSLINGYPDRSPKSVDDLWHATINGRGQMFSATSPDVVISTLSSIFSDVLQRTGASAGVTVTNPANIQADNSSYASQYISGSWIGDVNSYPVVTATGRPSATGVWTGGAKQQLDARNLGTSPRMIATFSGTAGTTFAAGSTVTYYDPASSAYQSSILLETAVKTPSVSPVDGTDVIAFLRGDRSKEGTSYRTRFSRLGDIVDSEIAVQTTSTGKYLYVGANDGMLHVFNGDPVTGGAEIWAYVPSFVLPKLNGLSAKTGFTHKYLVDGTPVLAGVDFQRTSDVPSASPDPRTILVGGLGKGGFGFYALDVTVPVPTSEANAAAKVLWEFPNSTVPNSNVGYSYGRPIIAQTDTYGWVVIVTSGYNNGTTAGDSGGDGHGHLFVLDAKTGKLIKDIDTGAGSAGTPSGLAQISAWNLGPSQNLTDFTYGGDLLGNVWRFDLTGNKTGWTAKKLATLVDGSSTAQPVTSAPELALATNKRMIYVGTGQYLGSADISSTATQTMYGLMDDLSTTPTISGPRSNLVAQTLSAVSGTTVGSIRTASSNVVDLATKKGWYIDFTNGERIITDPQVANGGLGFTSNIPSTDPCVPGGSSYLNVVDYKTGGQLAGIGWGGASYFLGNVLGSRPVAVKVDSGATEFLIRQSDATTVTVDGPGAGTGGSARRVSWRELFN